MRQGVHRRRAHPVQPTGGLVPRAAELAARMQPGQNQLDTRHARLGVNIGRDPPPVFVDLHRAVAGGERRGECRGGCPLWTVTAPATCQSSTPTRAVATRPAKSSFFALETHDSRQMCVPESPPWTLRTWNPMPRIDCGVAFSEL